MKTQYDKIFELFADNEWVCQKDFHPISWSPHKRRAEIEQKKDANGNQLYRFNERPCQHGIERSKDFQLVRLQPVTIESNAKVEVTLGI
jgi:hypothetical protein